MNIRRTNIATAPALQNGMDNVQPIPRTSGRMVPEKPTTEMLAAGSIAGSVSVEAAWNVYQAMLKAAPGKS